MVVHGLTIIDTHLNYRYRSVGIQMFYHAPAAMIQSPFLIQSYLGVVEEVCCFAGQSRTARRRILYIEQFFREASKIVYGFRMFHSSYEGPARKPVSGYTQYGIGSRHRLSDALPFL